MSKIGEVLNSVGKAVGQAAESYANTNSAAAAKANAVSQGAQAAAGAYNAGQAALANQIGDARIYQQQGFNSGQAQIANNFTAEMWDKAAAWNEMMWERQAEFNRQEAQKQRDWQTQMANTAYQRAYADMQKAGINPMLASGATPVMPSGGAASVGGASMGSASGQAASSGLLGADSASISGYSGQMETMNNTMALIAAAMNGLTTAAKSWSLMGANGSDFTNFITDIITGNWGDAAGIVGHKVEHEVDKFGHNLKKNTGKAITNYERSKKPNTIHHGNF